MSVAQLIESVKSLGSDPSSTMAPFLLQMIVLPFMVILRKTGGVLLATGSAIYLATALLASIIYGPQVFQQRSLSPAGPLELVLSYPAILVENALNALDLDREDCQLSVKCEAGALVGEEYPIFRPLLNATAESEMFAPFWNSLGFGGRLFFNSIIDPGHCSKQRFRCQRLEFYKKSIRTPNLFGTTDFNNFYMNHSDFSNITSKSEDLNVIIKPNPIREIINKLLKAI